MLRPINDDPDCTDYIQDDSYESFWVEFGPFLLWVRPEVQVAESTGDEHIAAVCVEVYDNPQNNDGALGDAIDMLRVETPKEEEGNGTQA